MSIGPKQKQKIVHDLSEVVFNSTSVIAADYRGLKSSDMTELRANMRKLAGKVHVQIVRNTLAKLALKNTIYEELIKNLVGPVVLVFIKDEVSCAARALKDFIKEKEKLTVRALVVEGTVFAGNQLELISKLPTKQEAIAKLVVVTQAPIAQFVRTLAEPYGKLVRTVMAVCNTK